jgi:hypothetical protein
MSHHEKLIKNTKASINSLIRIAESQNFVRRPVLKKTTFRKLDVSAFRCEAEDTDYVWPVRKTLNHWTMDNVH